MASENATLAAVTSGPWTRNTSNKVRCAWGASVRGKARLDGCATAQKQKRNGECHPHQRAAHPEHYWLTTRQRCAATLHSHSYTTCNRRECSQPTHRAHVPARGAQRSCPCTAHVTPERRRRTSSGARRHARELELVRKPRPNARGTTSTAEIGVGAAQTWLEVKNKRQRQQRCPTAPHPGMSR